MVAAIFGGRVPTCKFRSWRRATGVCLCVTRRLKREPSWSDNKFYAPKMSWEAAKGARRWCATEQGGSGSQTREAPIARDSEAGTTT